jgi:hypothetical protein
MASRFVVIVEKLVTLQNDVIRDEKLPVYNLLLKNKILTLTLRQWKTRQAFVPYHILLILILCIGSKARCFVNDTEGLCLIDTGATISAVKSALQKNLV